MYYTRTQFIGWIASTVQTHCWTGQHHKKLDDFCFFLFGFMPSKSIWMCMWYVVFTMYKYFRLFLFDFNAVVKLAGFRSMKF